MADLFDIPLSLSPRLAWLQCHGLTIIRLESGRYECALDDETFARGEDEDEACWAFCAKTALRHYSQD